MTRRHRRSLAAVVAFAVVGALALVAPAAQAACVATPPPGPGGSRARSWRAAGELGGDGDCARGARTPRRSAQAAAKRTAQNDLSDTVVARL